jgi:general L-amino acid transport system substrate-binding protein
MNKSFASLLPLVALLSINVSSAHADPNSASVPGPTLAAIKAANSLSCGVDFEEAEYSTADAHGNHSIFDLDLCKAVAVAVLGPNAKLKIVPYRDEVDALEGLKSGAIAVLATASPNFINTTAGFGFSRPVFYDYQGFLVNKTMGIQSSRDLANKKTCFLGGTEIEIQIQGYMQREGIKWLPFPFQEEGEMEAAFITSNCAAITADVSQLAYERLAFKGMAKNFAILPDVVATDPLSIAYRLGDPQWAATVNWVAEALILAEESGVTQANVAAMKKSDDPLIQRLLGTQHGYGQYLGLDDAWAARTIEAVGNYGELYERDLGSGSVMKLPRGANNLSTKGGLMLALPIR